MEEAVVKAKKEGKAVGTFVESVQDAKKWADIGVQYISYAVDVGIIVNAFQDIVRELNRVTNTNK